MNVTIKSSLVLALCVLVQTTWAQIPLTVKTIDQDALLKGKQWRLVDAGMSAGNELYSKVGQPSFDVDRSVGDSSVTYTHNGMAWNSNRFYINTALDMQRI
jgi:hypothetical protein